jgi:hypothetical protein
LGPRGKKGRKKRWNSRRSGEGQELGGDTLACGGRGWRDPIPTMGQILWYSGSVLYTVRNVLLNIHFNITMNMKHGM